MAGPIHPVFGLTTPLHCQHTTSFAGQPMQPSSVNRSFRSHYIRSAGAPYSTRPSTVPIFDATAQHEVVSPSTEGKRPNLTAIVRVLQRSKLHTEASNYLFETISKRLPISEPSQVLNSVRSAVTSPGSSWTPLVIDGHTVLPAQPSQRSTPQTTIDDASLDVLLHPQSPDLEQVDELESTGDAEPSRDTSSVMRCQFSGCRFPIIKATPNAINRHIIEQGHVFPGQRKTHCPWPYCKYKEGGDLLTVRAFPKHVFGKHSRAPPTRCDCGREFPSRRSDSILRHKKESCVSCICCLKDFSEVFESVVTSETELRTVAIAARKLHQLTERCKSRFNWTEKELGVEAELEAVVAPYRLRLQGLDGASRPL